MERLTTREEHPHGAEGRSQESLTGRWCRGCFEATACVEKLAEYENAEEDGRLIILPCNIVWTITGVGRKDANIVPRFIQELTLYEIYGIDECGKDFSSKEAALEGLRNIRERK